MGYKKSPVTPEKTGTTEPRYHPYCLAFSQYCHEREAAFCQLTPDPRPVLRRSAFLWLCDAENGA